MDVDSFSQYTKLIFSYPLSRNHYKPILHCQVLRCAANGTEVFCGRYFSSFLSLLSFFLVSPSFFLLSTHLLPSSYHVIIIFLILGFSALPTPPSPPLSTYPNLHWFSPPPSSFPLLRQPSSVPPPYPLTFHSPISLPFHPQLQSLSKT